MVHQRSAAEPRAQTLRAPAEAPALLKAETQALQALEQPPADHAETAFRRGLPGQVRSEVGVGDAPCYNLNVRPSAPDTFW